MRSCHSIREVEPVTKEEMSQLSDLREEINELEQDILNLNRYSQTGRVVTDKVQASSRDFPYTQTTLKITGIEYKGDKRKKKKIAEKRRIINKRRTKAEALEKRITEYISSVPDSRIRRMMEYKYEKGYTWEQIGKLLHCDRTTVEKTVAKYIQEHPEEETDEQRTAGD